MIFALSSAQLFATTNCKNLGHLKMLYGSKIEIHQINCEKFVRYYYTPDGTLYSTNEVLLNGEWKVTNTNDEYETDTIQQRWRWSKNGNFILRDFIRYGRYKQHNEIDFFYQTISEKYYLDNDLNKVIVETNNLLRYEYHSGEIKIDSSNDLKEYLSLK